MITRAKVPGKEILRQLLTKIPIHHRWNTKQLGKFENLNPADDNRWKGNTLRYKTITEKLQFIQENCGVAEKQ